MKQKEVRKSGRTLKERVARKETKERKQGTRVERKEAKVMKGKKEREGRKQNEVTS